MVAHPYIKIFLSLLAGIFYWRSVTPPVPPPSAKDEVRSEGLFGYIVRQLSWISKMGVLTSLLCQSATIATLHQPSRHTSQILSHICPVRPSPPLRHLSQLPPAFHFGIALIILGSLVRTWCFRTLDGLFTFEITIRSSHKLVRTGPYAIVRHPSYIAQALIILGVVIASFADGSWVPSCDIMHTHGGYWVGTWIFLASFTILSLVRRGAVEDRVLEKTFGKEWAAYSHDVPYRFVPGIL